MLWVLDSEKALTWDGGFKINISKSGIGYSWGTKGYRVTKTAKGSVRQTLTVPGCGVSFVTEKSSKSKQQPLPVPPPCNNHLDTQEFVNATATDMTSESLQDILKSARQIIWLNNFSSFGIIIFLFLGFINILFAFFWLASIALKVYIKTAGLINLEYLIDDDQKDIVAQRMKPLLKVLESKKVWRITQSSKVIDKRYFSGASNSIKRVLCKTSKKVPFPFKSNIPAAVFKSGKETLIFLPDNLFIIQSKKIGALNYSDISTSVNTTRFIEENIVPTDATIVGKTWQYVNKSGGPDKRFKSNRELPICKYGEISLKSSSGLNTVLMFSNINLN